MRSISKQTYNSSSTFRNNFCKIFQFQFSLYFAYLRVTNIQYELQKRNRLQRRKIHRSVSSTDNRIENRFQCRRIESASIVLENVCMSLPCDVALCYWYSVGDSVLWFVVGSLIGTFESIYRVQSVGHRHKDAVEDGTGVGVLCLLEGPPYSVHRFPIFLVFTEISQSIRYRKI